MFIGGEGSKKLEKHLTLFMVGPLQFVVQVCQKNAILRLFTSLGFLRLQKGFLRDVKKIGFLWQFTVNNVTDNLPPQPWLPQI